MSQKDKTATIAFMRKMQIIAPAGMIVLGALVFALWKDEMSPLVSGVIAFLAIPDFLAFKFIADRMEQEQYEN